MSTFRPKDAIALLTILCITALKFKGFDGQLDAVGALILGYYFAHRKDGTDLGL